MLLETAIGVSISVVAKMAANVPEVSLAAYTELRNWQATRVPFGGARRVSIDQAAEGRAVRIRGKAFAREGAGQLRGPVSGEPCAAWSLRVFRREVLWREHVRLHLVADASDSVPISISDGDRLAHLASPLIDLDGVPDVFEGRRLAEELPAGVASILLERGLDEASLRGCELHEHRLRLPAEVEVGGIASLRLASDGYRGTSTELWLECLPSGHLPLRLED